MTDTLRILLDIEPYYHLTDDQRQAILAAAPNATLHYERRDAELDLDAYPAAGDIHVLVSGAVPRHLSRWRNLRFIQHLAAGVDSTIGDGHPIWEADIPVATASGVHSVPMAQFATCALLILAHRMAEITQLTTTRAWPAREALAGKVVRGLTAGIVGYGSVGRECGRQLHALGLRILAMKRNPAHRRDEGFTAWPGTGDPDGTLPLGWYSHRQAAEMLPQCDVLVIAAPLTRETRGLIGTQELALLKPGAYVIIVSRGGIVDEQALADALHTGHLGGAVVDCFGVEPIRSDNPLFGAPNLLLTPHMSGVYDAFWPTMVKLLCENLRRLHTGRPLLNLVNGHAGY